MLPRWRALTQELHLTFNVWIACVILGSSAICIDVIMERLAWHFSSDACGCVCDVAHARDFVNVGVWGAEMKLTGARGDAVGTRSCPEVSL